MEDWELWEEGVVEEEMEMELELEMEMENEMEVEMEMEMEVVSPPPVLLRGCSSDV